MRKRRTRFAAHVQRKFDWHELASFFEEMSHECFQTMDRNNGGITMSRRWVKFLVVTALVATVVGCSQGAEELIKTAKFEELQRNYPHARELYQRVVDQYPNSEEAKLAAERLAAIKDDPPPP